MKLLAIDGTKSTPTVSFDPTTNELSLAGQSYPENAFKLYEQLFQWVDEYLEQLPNGVTALIKFNLPYINTSSSKCIMMLLEKFDNAFSNGKQITLDWYYNEDNESELECAEEFIEDLNLPFQLIPYIES
jgi:hypothetical protein